MTTEKVTGACLCGAVRIEADGPPRRVTHCHCAMCRRATGAVAGTFAAFESDRVRWLGELARYDSSERAWRGFCPRCGSSVCFGYRPRPERTYVALGILDEPDRFPAGFHDYRDAQVAWLHLDPALPDAPRGTSRPAGRGAGRRRITGVAGRRVWDSRGRPTVEAEVHLAGGATGRAIAPAGASTGSGEATDLRDGGDRLGGYDVRRAVANVGGVIAGALSGMDAGDQESVDRALVDLDASPAKSRLGGNATVAVSMAVAHAAAAAAGEPLWRHLLAGREAVLPLPEVQIFGGGAHAARRVDVQDFMVVCPGAESFGEALEWTSEIYRRAGVLLAESGRLRGVADEGGYWPEFETNEAALDTLLQAIEAAGLRPGEQVGIALDVAASEFGRDGRYELGLERRVLDREGLVALLEGWLDRYPIVSVEDPLAEDDDEGFAAFTRAAGDRVQIVGDDYLVTSADRVRRAAAAGACNALLVKPNQAGTLSEARAALEAARDAGWTAIVSARSGESEDVTVVHLAVGWGVGQLKVGSFARSERMAKWNEGLRIEEALGDAGAFARGMPGGVARDDTGSLR